MNQQRSKERIREEIELQLKERGYATAVDTLIRIGWLTPANFEAWKKGKIPYLEKGFQISLGHSKRFMDHYITYAKEKGYKLRWTYYKQIGSKRLLRFSKSNIPEFEKIYATHIVCIEKKGS